MDQEGAFDAVCIQSGILDSALEGKDSTLLAYGQTGSGKTYTMFGAEPIAKCPKRDEGIVPRAFRWIFDQANSDEDIVKCQVYVEAVEVYMGKLRDLFEPTIKNKPKRLRIGETKETFGVEKEEQVKPRKRIRHAKPPRKKKKDTKTFIMIDGAFEAVAQNAEEIVQLIARAWKNRTTEQTDANAVSSRSHMLLRTRICIEKEDGTQIQSRLTFGDLAGSEKTKYSNVRGKQMKQAQDINKQLFVLRQCVDAILNNKKRIPYPDACLTKVLQKSVEGKTQLTFLTCGSPHRMNRPETLGTLQFGNQCRQLEVTVVKNVAETKETLQNKLRAREEELKSLRSKMREHKRKSLILSEDEVDSLKRELEMKKAELEITKQELARKSMELESVERELRSVSMNMRSCSANFENSSMMPPVPYAHDGERSRQGSVSSFDETLVDMVQMETENQTLRSLLQDKEALLHEYEEQIHLKTDQIESRDNILTSLQQENKSLTQQRRKNVTRQQSITQVLGTREDEIAQLRKTVKRLRKAASTSLPESGSWGKQFELRTAQSKLERLEAEVAQKDAEIENLKRSNTKLQLKVVRLHKNAPLNINQRRTLSNKSSDGTLDVAVQQAFLSSSSCDSGSSDHAISSTIRRQNDLIKEMLELLMEDTQIDATDVGELEGVISRLKNERRLGASRSASCGPVEVSEDISRSSKVEVIDGVACYE